MTNESLKQIFDRIDQASHILLISHRKPDGDTLGATLGFSYFLKNQNKSYTLFCVDTIPQSFSYLKDSDAYILDISQREVQNVDLVIVFDAADRKQTGCPDFLEHSGKDIINIDHHFTNQNFGLINYVSCISSTCELVYHMFKEKNIKIDAEMATALLTGLMTDTDGFTNPATTQEAINAGAYLMRKGARFKQIMKHVLKNKRIQDLQLWGKILSTLHTNKEWGCVVSIITLEDLMKYNVDEEATIGIANFLNLLSETRMALVLRELPDGKIKGSFRTNRDDVDVSKLAKQFGGGGHKKAAGFTITGQLSQNSEGWVIL